MGHIRAMFGLFLQYHGFYMTQMAQICTGESCKPNREIPINFKLLGPYKGHVWAIFGPCFGYFYNIFASRCPKWLKFLLERHICQIEEYHSMSNYLDHIRAMLGPCLGHVLAISTISLLLDDWNGSTFHWRDMHAK